MGGSHNGHVWRDFGETVLLCLTLRGPPHSVPNAQGTPLIDDNVTHLCYFTMYNIGLEKKAHFLA